MMNKIVTFVLCLASAGLFGGTTYPVSDVASLTEALGKAGDGDVIECAAGTYLISAEISLSVGVTLRGAGIGKTVLKSANSKTSMRILSLANKDAVVENLTLDGGYLTSGNGAGAYVTAGTLQDCEIMNCSENHWGGVLGCGVYATGADALVLRCDIHDNFASMGSGIGLCLANYAVARNCLIRDNSGTSGNAHYSAFINQYGTLENCTVTRNNCWNDAALGTKTGNNNYKQIVTNCVVWGNAGNTPLAASSSVIGEGWTIEGDLRRVTNTTIEDPDFIDYEGGDFRLDAASPCVAAGQGCYPFDTTATTCGVFTVTRAVFPGETVVFTAGAFNCSGDYIWDFGDGTAPVTTTKPTVTHTYATYGTYDVGLTVGAASCLRPAYVRVCPRTMYAHNNSSDPVPPYATPKTAAQYIEDALDLAIDGSEIVVLAGTHQMRGTTPIKIFKGVTVRGETGVKEDVIVEKETDADQVFHLNHKLARVESLTMDGKKRAHGSGQDKNGGCVRLEGLGGTVSNCVMRGIAYAKWGDRGGGVYMEAGFVTHCVISNNEVEASSGGGGVYMSGGTVANSLITRNRVPGSSYDGGAVKMAGAGTLVNCTIVGNTAGKYPGVVFTSDKAKVINCLFSDNVSANIEDAAAGVYNNEQFADLFTACAAPLKINDTCFTGNLGIKSARTDDFHLVVGSVCLGNAMTDGIDVPATDLDGNPRLDDSGKLDIGCYQLTIDGVQVAFAADVNTPTAALAPFDVTYNATVAGADPTTLTYRWDVYGNGSQIVETDKPTLTFRYERYGNFSVKLVVVKGDDTYEAVNQVEAASYPPVHYVNCNNETPEAPYDTPAKAANDLATAVAAAYAGAEVVVKSGRYPLTAQVFIDKAVTVRGETGDPEDVVFYRSNRNMNHRIFSLNNSKATIASLTAEGGYLSGNNSDGGNVYVGLSGGTVTNCVLRNGYVGGWDAYGGGLRIAANAQNALVTHCVITNNGVSTGSSPGDITGGGGAYISSGVLRNSLIAYNYQVASDTHDANFGGGVTMDGGLLESCTVAANRARICSGVNAKDGMVRNCVIAGNESTVSTDPARKVWSGKDTAFDRCLAPVKINDSCLVQEQPFVSVATGDFALAAGSDGIDAADPQDWMVGATDLAGNDRIRGDRPDIGAYEADASAFAASFSVDGVSEGFGPLSVAFTVTPVNAGDQGVRCAWVVDGDASEVTTRLAFTNTFALGDHTVSLTVTDVASGAVFPVPGFVRIFSAPRTMYVAPPDGTVTSVYPYATCETAATNVKHAVEAALLGTEIVMLKGRHKTTDITYLNAPVTIRGETGRPEDVVIRASARNSRVFSVNNAQVVVKDMSIEGYTAGSGNTACPQGVYFDSGGGTVSNCIVRGCGPAAWGDTGGAVYMNSCDAVLTHCVISNNTIGCTDGCEKGIAVAIAKGRMENCLVAFNRSGNSSGTRATSNGGAVYLSDGSMVNCTVVSNSYQGCAGVYATGGMVANCLIVGNRSTLAGGEASVWRGDTVDCFTHCLGEVQINDSCLTGSTEVFKQARIKKGVFIPLGKSAARDAGDNVFVTEATDLYGNPRVFGGKVDLGCAESQTGGFTIYAR